MQCMKIDLERVEAESKQNLAKIEELEQTLFDLSGEIAGGRHVPPNTRVLSIKDNPEQEWFDLRQAAMDRLKGENQALMKRLKELEESGAKGTHINDDGDDDGRSNTELVPRESWELVNREKKELEDTVKQKEKRLLRLQQVYISTYTKYLLFNWIIFVIIGIYIQKRRVPRNHRLYPRSQTRILPKRTSSRHIHVRSLRFLHFPTHIKRPRCSNAARS